MKLIDDLVDFIRGRGYVLDFSDSTFSDFFTSELDVDIDDPIYAEHGGSKGMGDSEFSTTFATLHSRIFRQLG